MVRKWELLSNMRLFQKKGRKIKNGIKKVKRVFNNPKITPHDAYNAFLSFLTEYLESNFCVFGYSNIKKETYFLRIRDFKRIDDLKIPTALWCKPNPNTNRFNIENEKMLYTIYRGKSTYCSLRILEEIVKECKLVEGSYQIVLIQYKSKKDFCSNVVNDIFAADKIVIKGGKEFNRFIHSFIDVTMLQKNHTKDYYEKVDYIKRKLFSSYSDCAWLYQSTFNQMMWNFCITEPAAKKLLTINNLFFFYLKIQDGKYSFLPNKLPLKLKNKIIEINLKDFE